MGCGTSKLPADTSKLAECDDDTILTSPPVVPEITAAAEQLLAFTSVAFPSTAVQSPYRHPADEAGANGSIFPTVQPTPQLQAQSPPRLSNGLNVIKTTETEGTLEKKGGLVESWRYRLFVLRNGGAHVIRADKTLNADERFQVRTCSSSNSK